MTTPGSSQSASPRWGPSMKMAAGLSIAVILLVLLYQFRSIIGPIIIMFVLAYLLHPLGAWLSLNLKISWKLSINLIFLVLVILLLASFTVVGVALVTQIQSLVGFVTRFINDLPTLVANLSSQTHQLGPWELNLGQYDLVNLANQLLSIVQPILGQLGSLVSSLATGAASTLGWVLFILVTTYFLLAEARQVSQSIVQIEIPGYDSDIRRLSSELNKIWNAFLRGQLLMISIVIVVYAIVLGILGLRYPMGIAIMAGLARLVPYIGPWVTWVTMFLVALLQGGNYFGLVAWKYALLVVVLCIVIDTIFDNVVQPRLMGQRLGVHPAAVLVAAIILTRLIGLVGLVLAAPVLATLTLLSRYLIRKLFDQDPWPVEEPPARVTESPWAVHYKKLKKQLTTHRRT